MSTYRRSRKSQSRNEEFQEQDMWGVANERKEPSFISKRQPTAARIMIPTDNKSFNVDEPRIVQNSAPVSIPDWSKIYGESSKNGNGDDYVRSSWESDEEDDDGNLIPPHEFIARKLARKQISSFSVCEGAGRTLKGRDLSRVRNAVLSKTGFLE
ncbi:Hypothetical predicted protein [Olea europaea subsp. europaea]|uniref:Senescence regulator n=2 Tax=Olea europaea subsp. europaea TaxID=158383 RepID=A0A8S0U638_OLEEU|nr:Hypothetical predicted protein [Olea europaea subsp. europaea]